MFLKMKLKKKVPRKEKKEKKKRPTFLYFLTNIISEYIQNTARLRFSLKKLMGKNFLNVSQC